MKRFACAIGAVVFSAGLSAADDTATYALAQLPYLDAYVSNYSCDSSLVSLDIDSRTRHIFDKEESASVVNRFLNGYLSWILELDEAWGCERKLGVKRYFIEGTLVFTSDTFDAESIRSGDFDYMDDAGGMAGAKDTNDYCTYAYLSGLDTEHHCRDSNFFVSDDHTNDEVLSAYYIDGYDYDNTFSIGMIVSGLYPGAHYEIMDDVEGRRDELCDRGLSIYCLGILYNHNNILYHIDTALEYGRSLADFTVREFELFRKAANLGQIYAVKIVEEIADWQPELYASLMEGSPHISHVPMSPGIARVAINRWLSNECVDSDAFGRIADTIASEGIASDYLPRFVESFDGCSLSLDQRNAVGVGLKEVRDLSCAPVSLDFARCSFVSVLGANFRTGDSAADQLFSNMWNRHVPTTAEFANIPGYGWMVLGLETH